jgi:hypothetical protein
MNSTQATANDNVSASTVSTENGVTVYRNIKDRDHKRGGKVTEGRVCRGQHAAVEAGKQITLWGVDRNNVKGFRPYRIEFKIGDAAEYDSFNLSYTGTIVAIGAKTVSIQHERGGKITRLSIHEFSWRNNDFDAVKIAEQNSDMMMSL